MVTNRIDKLKLLYKKGKMTPKLRRATGALLKELKDGKLRSEKFYQLTWLHQNIAGVIKGEVYGEDDDFNMNLAGTTVYREFDYLSHSSTGEAWYYVKGS